MKASLTIIQLVLVMAMLSLAVICGQHSAKNKTASSGLNDYFCFLNEENTYPNSLRTGSFDKPSNIQNIKVR